MSFIGSLLGVPDQKPSPLRLVVNPAEPRKLIIGRSATAGALAFQGVSDSQGRQREGDNRVAQLVYVLSGHRVRSLTRFWADGELVRSSPLVHGVRTEITGFAYEGKPRLFATFYDGRDDQPADPHLVSQYILPYRRRSTDRLAGCAKVVISATHSTETLTSIPSFIFEIEGAYLYDRRKDTTAGGSGSHRWDDPDSWAYSDNPAVATDHYQLGIVGGASGSINFGMGLTAAQVPFDSFAENADVCDELVNGRTRYAANGIISANEDHQQVIVKLARAMAAQPIDTGGQLIIRPQQARSIALTLTDDDLVDSAAYEFEPSPSGTDLINTVRGTFRNPDTRHNEEDYPSVEDADLITQDGRVFEHTLNLDFENNSERAQHLANIELEIQKRRDRLSETFMPIVNVLEAGDWFERQSNLRGAVTKTYEVIRKRVREDLTVEIEARETDPSITGWGEDEARPITTPTAPEHVTSHRPETPIVTVTPGVETGGGATFPVARIDVTLDEGDLEDDAEAIEIEYGVWDGVNEDDPAIADGERSLTRFNITGEELILTGLLPATTYAYRVRTVYQGLASEWTDYALFTTSESLVVPTSGDTEAVGGRDAADVLTSIDAIRDVAQEYLDVSQERISAVSDQVRTLMETQIERDRVVTVVMDAGLFNDGEENWLSTNGTDPLAALPTGFDADWTFTDADGVSENASDTRSRKNTDGAMKIMDRGIDDILGVGNGDI